MWSVEGFYAYTDSNGDNIKMNYVADDQGFRTKEDNTPNRKQEFQAQISKNKII